MQFDTLVKRVRALRLTWGWRTPLLLMLISFVTLLIGGLLLFAQFFGPADTFAETKEFVVKPDAGVFEVTRELRQAGFIKSTTAFAIAYSLYDNGREIREGGYKISASMDTLAIAKALASPPYLAWVTFPGGWRKEQIAELLVRKLGWSEEERLRFVTVDTAPAEGFEEGVYYGGTYLIPTDQSSAYVAARLRGRFQEVSAEYAREAAQRGIAWSDVIILASLIEREAARDDKRLVSGILWNRLHKGMGLQVDATLQYIRGEKGNWWPVPTPADKKLVSPFNTYKHVGLPPHPIANPSLASIEAALRPEKTNCFFYLHGNDGVIRCAPTYAGHIRNVNKYLK